MTRVSDLINAGLSIWPMNKDKTPVTFKNPYYTWDNAKTKHHTDYKYFNTAYGVAIVCGAISKNIICIDIDCKYDLTGALFDTLSGMIAEHIYQRFTVQQTPSGGYHYWFLVDGEVPASGKLAMRPGTQQELYEYNVKAQASGQKIKTDPNKHPKTLIEIKGTGGYALCEPTPNYILIQGSFTELKTLSSEELEIVLNTCKEFNLVIEEKHEIKPRQKTDYVSQNDIEPWDDFNNRHTALEILEQYGWKEGKHVPRGIEVVHFSTDKSKSGLVNKTNTAVFIHSQSTCLPDNKWLTPYAIYVFNEHNGDFAAAAKELLKKGYGKKMEQKQQLQPAPLQVSIPTPTAPSKWQGGYFKPLGFDRNDEGVQAFYFHVTGAQMPIRLTVSKMTAHNLLMLAPMSYWVVNFPAPERSRSKFDLDLAIEYLITTSNQVGFYSVRNIRGRGAWLDEDRTVIHLGDKLLCDWDELKLTEIDSKFVYELAPAMTIGYNNPLTQLEAKMLVDILSRLNWERESDFVLLAGWIYIAPICGILKWRPHIWITGEAGSGKSTVFRDIVKMMLGDSCLSVQGGSSEAGIREDLKYDSRPVLFEEGEGNTAKSSDMIERVLEYARASSADNTGDIIKGSGNGAKRYKPRAIFALASIVPQMSNQADRRRITMLNLIRKRDDEKWSETEQMIYKNITEDFAERFQARTIQNIPLFLQSLKVINTELAVYLKDKSLSDQLAPMIAGAWHILSDKVINEKQANSWFERMNISERTDESTPDQIQCIRRILSREIRLDTGATKTIGEMLFMARWGVTSVEQSNGLTDSDVKQRLGRCGIKLEYPNVFISNTSNFITDALKDSPWHKNYSEVLRRIKGAEAGINVKYFSPMETSRFVSIPFDEVIGKEI